MLLGELLDDERREAREEGRNQMLALIKAMTADGKADQLPLLEEDPSFLAEMLEKYHIS